MTDTVDTTPGTEETTEQQTTQETTQETTQAVKYDFVLDKYRKEGRTEDEAAFEQAKAYNEAQKRLGGFVGAPDAYEVTLSDELAEMGVAIDPDDPMIISAMEFAKESNMNQELFAKMVNMYAANKVAEQQAQEAYYKESLKTLGHNAEARIKSLNDIAKARLSPELYEGFLQAGTTPEAIQALEAIFAMSQPKPISPKDVEPADGVTDAELREMQFAKDDHGNRRIATDPAYKAEYEKKLALRHGNQPYVKMIG